MANEPQPVKVTFDGREIEVFEGWTGAFEGRPGSIRTATHPDAVIHWIHVMVAVLSKAGVRDSTDHYELRLQNGTVLAPNDAVPFPPPKTLLVARASVGG